MFDRRALFLLPLALSLGADCTAVDDDDDAVEPSAIVINEFMAANASIFEDDTGAFPDWIELFNTGTADVALGSYAVSDSLGQPLKHLLSDDLVIPAGGYLILFADGDTDQGPDHISFRLTSGGEDLVLSRLVGSAAEVVDSYQYGEQLTDVSEGRVPNGTGSFVPLDTPTPGASNG